MAGRNAQGPPVLIHRPPARVSNDLTSYPAGMVMIGGCSFVPVSTSVKMNMRKLNRRLDKMSMRISRIERLRIAISLLFAATAP